MKLLNESNLVWKSAAIEFLLAKIIEHVDEVQWKNLLTQENLRNFIDKYENFMTKIDIRGLQPTQSTVKNPYNQNILTVNYPSNECHRMPLNFLSKITHLKELCIEFGVAKLNFPYERRFFQNSIEDVKYLSEGLCKLVHLNKLEITRTDLCEGISVLLASIKNSKNLTNLTLSYCKIGKCSSSGEAFKHFLIENTSVERIELRDNKLTFDFCSKFSIGVGKHEKHFKYIGLSLNPIFNEGLELILNSIASVDNVTELNISTCVGEKRTLYDINGWVAIQKIIQITKNLKTLDVSNNNAKSLNMKKFLQKIKNNFAIEKIDVENCGKINSIISDNFIYLLFFLDLSIKDQVDLSLLLSRNQYFRENPCLLNTQNLSSEEEVEIEKWLKRVRHPLLLKYMKT
jgi:hypothetical protein